MDDERRGEVRESNNLDSGHMGEVAGLLCLETLLIYDHWRQNQRGVEGKLDFCS